MSTLPPVSARTRLFGQWPDLPEEVQRHCLHRFGCEFLPGSIVGPLSDQDRDQVAILVKVMMAMSDQDLFEFLSDKAEIHPQLLSPRDKKRIRFFRHVAQSEDAEVRSVDRIFAACYLVMKEYGESKVPFSLISSELSDLGVKIANLSKSIDQMTKVENPFLSETAANGKDRCFEITVLGLRRINSLTRGLEEKT